MRIYFFIIALCNIILCYSQELSVIEDLSELPTSAYARTHPVYVGSGEDRQLCAVIRVSMVLPEVKFEGTYFKQQNSGDHGEYIVYVAPGCKKLTVLSSSFFPFDYAFPKPAEEGVTYRLVLGFPENSKSVVRIRTNAKIAHIELAGQSFDTESGHFELRLPKGEYNYVLSSTLPGFEQAEGKIVVDDVYYMERINLKSASQYKLTIQADEKSRILIDGVEQKKKGSFQTDVDAGIHSVEAFTGTDERWNKRIEVDLTKGNATADMSMRGNLRIVYPSNAQFEIIPKNGAFVPSKKTIKTGETISLLGDYDIKVDKKNYEEVLATVTINPNANVDNFKIAVVSKADNYFYGINNTRQDYRKAIKEYEKMASKDDDIAQYKLAQCYENGYGGMKNLDRARTYYQLASAAGHYDATYSLARLTADARQREKLYIQAAQQGSIPSMEIAGNFFLEKKDYDNAKKYFEMGISEGADDLSDQANGIRSNCLLKLGEIYYNAYGVNKDVITARSYYEKSAGLGNVHAYERLADYLYYGYNGKVDKNEAINQYLKLGDSLSTDGMLKVGMFYYEKQEYADAHKYLSTLISKNVDLPTEMGEVFYRMGGEMYNKDIQASYTYYIKALGYGVVKPRQMVRLGYMYLNGKGTDVDYDKAKVCFEKAFELKDNEATCMLGYMHETGKGCIKDIKRAIQLYEIAGRNGYMRAYNNLGSLYAASKDMDKAEHYWELAGKAGNTTAINNLIKFYKNRHNSNKEGFWKAQLEKVSGGK